MPDCLMQTTLDPNYFKNTDILSLFSTAKSQSFRFGFEWHEMSKWWQYSFLCELDVFFNKNEEITLRISIDL